MRSRKIEIIKMLGIIAQCERVLSFLKDEKHNDPPASFKTGVAISSWYEFKDDLLPDNQTNYQTNEQLDKLMSCDSARRDKGQNISDSQRSMPQERILFAGQCGFAVDIQELKYLFGRIGCSTLSFFLKWCEQ